MASNSEQGVISGVDEDRMKELMDLRRRSLQEDVVEESPSEFSSEDEGGQPAPAPSDSVERRRISSFGVNFLSPLVQRAGGQLEEGQPAPAPENDSADEQINALFGAESHDDLLADLGDAVFEGVRKVLYDLILDSTDSDDRATFLSKQISHGSTDTKLFFTLVANMNGIFLGLADTTKRGQTTDFVTFQVGDSEDEKMVAVVNKLEDAVGRDGRARTKNASRHYSETLEQIGDELGLSNWKGYNFSSNARSEGVFYFEKEIRLTSNDDIISENISPFSIQFDPLVLEILSYRRKKDLSLPSVLQNVNTSRNELDMSLTPAVLRYTDDQERFRDELVRELDRYVTEIRQQPDSKNFDFTFTAYFKEDKELGAQISVSFERYPTGRPGKAEKLTPPNIDSSRVDAQYLWYQFAGDRIEGRNRSVLEKGRFANFKHWLEISRDEKPASNTKSGFWVVLPSKISDASEDVPDFDVQIKFDRFLVNFIGDEPAPQRAPEFVDAESAQQNPQLSPEDRFIREFMNSPSSLIDSLFEEKPNENQNQPILITEFDSDSFRDADNESTPIPSDDDSLEESEWSSSDEDEDVSNRPQEDTPSIEYNRSETGEYTLSDEAYYNFLGLPPVPESDHDELRFNGLYDASPGGGVFGGGIGPVRQSDNTPSTPPPPESPAVEPGNDEEPSSPGLFGRIFGDSHEENVSPGFPPTPELPAAEPRPTPPPISEGSTTRQYGGSSIFGMSGHYANKRSGHRFEPKSSKIEPFPTSPLPRQSLGNIAVRVRPPPRGKGTQTTIKDYVIPENHMVFFYNAGSNGTKTYGASGSSRSRVAVVGDVFSNWWNRYGNFNDRRNLSDIRFAGVSYEGIMDGQNAKNHPDSKGRLTVTVNGVVSIYCRADDLDGAVLGDKLEWLPVGSRMSWRQIGKDFEPCVIRKFDVNRYDRKTVSNTEFKKLSAQHNTSSSFGPHISDEIVSEYPVLSTFSSMVSSVGSNPFDGSNDLLSFSKAQKNDMVKGLGDSHEATSMKNVVQSGFSSHEAHHILPEFDASVKTFASKYPNHRDVLVRNGVLSASHGKCSLNLDNMFTTSGSLKPGVDTAFSALSSSMKSHAVGRIASGLKDAMVRHHTSDSGFGVETGTYSKMFAPAAKSIDASSAMQTIMETSSSFNAAAREFGVSMPSYDLVNVKHATSTLLNAMDSKLQPLGSSAEALFSDVNGDRISPQDSRALRGALSTLSSQGIRTATLMSNVRKVNSMIKDPNVVAFADQNGDVFAMTGKSAAAASSDFGKSVGAYLDAKSIATDTSGLLGPYFEGSRNNLIDSKSTSEFFGQAVRGLSSTDASEFIAAYPTSAAFSDYANMCALGMGVGAVGGSNAEKYFDPSIGKLNFQSSSYDTAMSMPPTSSDFSTAKFVTDRNANSVMASCLLAAAHKNPSQVDDIMDKFTFTKVATKSRMSPVNVVFEDKNAAEAYSNHNSHKTIGDVERNEHGDFVVRFAPISTSTEFNQWFDGHKKYGTSAKAVFTDALADNMASLNSSIETHNEAAREHLAKVYESRFGPLDGQTSHLAAMMHDDASTISDSDMISTFGKFFVGKRATNPCHALDNPYLLVHAALPSEAMVECSSHGAIRPNSVECITSSDFSPLASDTKMMKVARSIRPTNTMAPFLIATSSLSDSPATSGRIVHTFVSDHESTQSPLSAVTTSMNMAKKLFSPEEYKTRAKMVGTKSIASKNHLLGALGSSLSQDARHLTTSQRFVLKDGRPLRSDRQPKAHDPQFTLNPYARVFGTLLDIDKEANTIRVMLNPALSNAPAM